MIFLYRARLVILSQPKTGTTALQRALGQRASMAVNGPPVLKHVSYRGFQKYFAPWFESQAGLKRDDYLVVSTMREPIDWLGSWYRYRTREKLADPDGADNPRAGNYTGGVKFDDFARDVCKGGDAAPAYARIKTPCWVALEHHNCIGVDRLFPYEDLAGLHDLIEERTGKPLETRQMNVSPQMELSLSDETLALIRETFAFELDLHASLRQDGQVEPRFREWNNRTDEEDYSSGV